MTAAASTSSSNLTSNNYYEILGIPITAKDAAIRKAYKKLAVKWHPDKNPGNEQATTNFQKISEAYATLSDDKKRKLYDAYGKEAADHHHDDNNDVPVTGGGRNSSSGGRHHNFSHGFSSTTAGGMPGGNTSFSFGGGGPGAGGIGQHQMSPEEAQFLFSQFFGGSDPFSGGMMGGGRQNPFGDISNSMNSMNIGPTTAGLGGRMSNNTRGGLPQKRQRTSSTSPHSSSQHQKQRFGVIPTGTVVTLKGLISQPERNGDRGQIVQQYDPNTERYIVQMEGSSTNETIKVKASNLFQQHRHGTIRGLVNKAKWNGAPVSVLAYDEHKERYNVYVSDDDDHTNIATTTPTSSSKKAIMSLKPSNIVLDTGTVGRITGLVSKPEWNDQWGTITNFDTESGRYDVQLSADTIVRLKLDNIRL